MSYPLLQTQLTGANFLEFIHPGDQAAVRHEIATSLAALNQAPAPPTSDCSFACRLALPSSAASHFPAIQPTYTELIFIGLVKALRDRSVAGRGQTRGHVFIAIARKPTTLSPPDLEPTKFTYRLTADGRFTAVDTAVTHILGYSPSDLHGTSLYRLCHHQDLAGLAENHRAVVQFEVGNGMVIVTAPYRLLARAGHYVTVVTHWQASRDPVSKAVDGIVARSRVTGAGVDVKPSLSPGFMGTLGERDAAMATRVTAELQSDERSQQSSSTGGSLEAAEPARVVVTGWLEHGLRGRDEGPTRGGKTDR